MSWLMISATRKSASVLSERRGNLPVQVRLEPAIWEAIRERIPPTERGRSGGVASWIRELVYRELELGPAPRFAAEASPRRKKMQTDLQPGTPEV
jgi:hypothetical protein